MRAQRRFTMISGLVLWPMIALGGPNASTESAPETAAETERREWKERRARKLRKLRLKCIAECVSTRIPQWTCENQLCPDDVTEKTDDTGRSAVPAEAGGKAPTNETQKNEKSGQSESIAPAADETVEAAPLDGEAIEATALDGEAIEAAPLDGEAIEATPLNGEAIEAAPLDGEAIEAAPWTVKPSKADSRRRREYRPARRRSGSIISIESEHRQLEEFCGPSCSTPSPTRSGSRPVDTLDTITIMGTAEELSRVSGSAHLVDEKALEEQEYDDVHRVLKQVPGVYVRDEDG